VWNGSFVQTYQCNPTSSWSITLLYATCTCHSGHFALLRPFFFPFLVIASSLPPSSAGVFHTKDKICREKSFCLFRLMLLAVTCCHCHSCFGSTCVAFTNLSIFFTTGLKWSHNLESFVALLYILSLSLSLSPAQIPIRVFTIFRLFALFTLGLFVQCYRSASHQLLHLHVYFGFFFTRLTRGMMFTVSLFGSCIGTFWIKCKMENWGQK